MKRILIVKIGALGDVARSTVMLSAVRERFPKAQVTWVTSASGAELLKLLADPPEILRLDAAALLKGNFAQRAKAVLDVNRHLLGQYYDLVLIPYRNAFYNLLRFGVRAKEVRSFWHPRGLIPGRCQCVDYTRLIWGEDGAAMRWPTFPPIDHAKLLTAHRSSQILLAPGSGNLLMEGAARRWPIENYVELARALRAQGLSVGVIGGSKDEVDTQYFSGLGVDDYVGATSIAELFSLLHRAEVLVANDSGPLHCMTLLGGGIVGLFGPTMASEMLGKGLHTQGIALESTLPCCPCYDGKNFAPCTQAPCMRQISVDSVLNAIHSVRQKAQSPAYSTVPKQTSAYACVL